MRAPLSAAILLAGPALAGEVVTYEVEAPFEDVTFDLKLAIEGKGFVIDATSHVGDMLNRTAADVGASRRIFTKADVFQFCSATVSRAVMEADILNIAHCPYGVFAYETPERPGVVTVGYRALPAGPMQEVQAVLDAIAREAAGE
jgi:uncharacterized protein (DUF302 family)